MSDAGDRDDGGIVTFSMTINGQVRAMTLELRTLLDALRDELGLTPIQAAFILHDDFQCAFCTSGQIDVLFVGGFDEKARSIGAKGLGELTAVPVAPAIANAVYHATDKRVRDLPITVEKML
jgi:hypothetical protein